MSKFKVPNRNQVDPKAQEIFDDLNKKMGLVPNLYAAMGYSSNALASYLAFSSAQTKGTFNAKEREAISLAVSETNQCGYCLAAHTAVAKMNGFSDEDTLDLRAGTIEDQKLNLLTRLAISIVENRGKADVYLIDKFFAFGYNEGALIDLIALVTDKMFTNFIGRLMDVPVDFPVVQSLEEVAV